MFGVKRASVLTTRCVRCYSSTTTPAPPLLQQIRTDLKTAMRAKDTNRLSVLRSILAEVSNSALQNPPKPITSDLSLLALLKKISAKSNASIAEFSEAKRQDLVDKEQAQLDIINEYAKTVKTMDVGEMEEIVKSVIDKMNADAQAGQKVALNVGTVMKALGDQLKDKAQQSDVANAIKKILSQ